MPSLLPPAQVRLAGRVFQCRRVSRGSPPSVSPSPRLYPHRPFSVSSARPSATPTTTTSDNSAAKPPPLPPSRWITELRTRVGKCLLFGCNSQQISQAAGVMRALATEWRELLAGSEGFLTGGRRGLDGREIVWGEMDTFGHVNNVNYYRYAESARVNWITNFAVHVDPAHREQWRELMSPRATGLIMRSLKADFKFPMVYPDKISVYHKLRAKPEGDPAPSSFFLDCIVLSHQHRRVSCRLEEDIVIYDYKAGGKTSMPSFMVELFDQTWKLQEQETLRARTRIWDLIRAVERLEKETWTRTKLTLSVGDRPDAVEDMGGSKDSSNT
ncbi:thioesterase-like superfamily-domain-containing protein [Chaetomium strumarium]|uniref:Thioesterase-like superfamily-domain-containing protein n=1 Tax=Chaetomium strumarium TaxID=1170767 RepID=A0AAJ0GY36_9PEZI|nr:thioesterase-like superfamily-domain-containing protein [Chaetomium strumarium]